MAYAELLADRDFLLVMMHGFSAGGIPEIGAAAPRRAWATSSRSCAAHRLARDEDVRDFIAQGMLLNVMIAMRAPEHAHENDPLARLTQCAFGDDPADRHALTRAS